MKASLTGYLLQHQTSRRASNNYSKLPMALDFPSLPLCLCQVFAALFFFVTSQADTTVRTVSLGSVLYANDDNITWKSSSGDFAFGFRKLPGQADQFLLAIWFAEIPEQTIVWSANTSSTVPRGSKLELTTDGKLMLTSPGGGEIWSTKNNDFLPPSQAAMLDSGNFVIRGNSPSITIWESFKNPTNTLLPTQVLNVGDKLSSGQIPGSSFSSGRFELVLLPEEMELRQVDPETGHPYDPYEEYPNVIQLIFNSTGLYTKLSDNGTNQVASGGPDSSGSLYYRAVLDNDGTLTLYTHPRDSAATNGSWSIVSVVPRDVCSASQGKGGSGACGFNSYCELVEFWKPRCGCPPGYSFLDQSNQYSGCKQDDAPSILEYCLNQTASRVELFDYNIMDGVDWPFCDFELRSPSTEEDCRRACSMDCFCAVAIFQDARFNNGIGNCWKKKLPLSNGNLNRNAIDRRALFKKLKNNASLLVH